MHAVRIHSFGDTDVLKVEEVPPPEPKENEIVVRVMAASVSGSSASTPSSASRAASASSGTRGSSGRRATSASSWACRSSASKSTPSAASTKRCGQTARLRLGSSSSARA